MIQFFASGTPKGQPRARAFAFHGKARMYDPATAEGWKAAVALAAGPHLPTVPHDEPLRVDLEFIMPRPASHYRTGKNAAELKPGAPLYFTSKPDRDNLDKAVLDALTVIGMWRDDAVVCDGRLTKRYQRDRGERPGVWVNVTKAI